eukprot:6208987-Pleurochrysis_carterae.AAC.2
MDEAASGHVQASCITLASMRTTAEPAGATPSAYFYLPSEEEGSGKCRAARGVEPGAAKERGAFIGFTHQTCDRIGGLALRCC